MNFIEGICHQKHENLLCLLIAQILRHCLSLSKFRYITESFLVSYHQTTIMYSSGLLHNMVSTQLGWIVWEATYVNEFIAWIQRTSKMCFVKMMLTTAYLWAKKIFYGGYFFRMKMINFLHFVLLIDSFSINLDKHI